MTRREKLQEQYEDALFALLMDEVAWQEGERLLEENERLKNDPDAEVPEEVVKRCQSEINREFAKKYASNVGRVSWRVFKKAAVAACVAVLLFTVAFATSNTVRVNTLNLIIDVCERYTDYSFAPAPKVSDTAAFSGFKVGWLPEGFTLADESTGEIQGLAEATYEGVHGETLSVILYSLSEYGTVGVDAEDATAENITINGRDATFISKDYYQIVVPFAETRQILCVCLFSETGLPSRDDLIKIVENITFE